MGDVTWYPESTGGFELFGVDLMVTEAHRVMLLEINPKPSLAHPHGTAALLRRMSREVIGGVLEFVVGDPGPGAQLIHIREVFRSS